MIILKNKNYPFNPYSLLNYNGNTTYRARNKLTDTIFSLEQAVQKETPVQPISEPAPGNEEQKVGYVSVSVFTASGALPVPDAVITIYNLDENGQENEISHNVTDANGQIPPITLPVTYDINSPESNTFSYSTYNLRAQAINYYTVNIIDFRVFPDITTYLTIDMIPAPAGSNEGTDVTIVISPSPVDIPND